MARREAYETAGEQGGLGLCSLTRPGLGQTSAVKDAHHIAPDKRQMAILWALSRTPGPRRLVPGAAGPLQANQLQRRTRLDPSGPPFA